MTDFYNNAIFWVETGRIQPNPFQPRREFNQDSLEDLADSIRQYGILQPLTVTRKEEETDSGIQVSYELVAGERRLRASKLAGLTQVPVLIRAKEDTDKVKLELAIIENLQREDLNPIDRAVAFQQLVDEFSMKHADIAKKVGKSREYVSNTLRLLGLPKHMQEALVNRKITEGHARPLLMLGDRKQEQETLFKEITFKKMTVREAERVARGIAKDKARKKDLPPELATLEKDLTEKLGTRVRIEKKDNGGKVHIDFFSEDDIRNLLSAVSGGVQATFAEENRNFAVPIPDIVPEVMPVKESAEVPQEIVKEELKNEIHTIEENDTLHEEAPLEQIKNIDNTQNQSTDDVYDAFESIEIESEKTDVNVQSLEHDHAKQSESENELAQLLQEIQQLNTNQEQESTAKIKSEENNIIPQTDDIDSQLMQTLQAESPVPKQENSQMHQNQFAQESVPQQKPQGFVIPDEAVPVPSVQDSVLVKQEQAPTIEDQEDELSELEKALRDVHEEIARMDTVQKRVSPQPPVQNTAQPAQPSSQYQQTPLVQEIKNTQQAPAQNIKTAQDYAASAPKQSADDDLYSVQNFTI